MLKPNTITPNSKGKFRSLWNKAGTYFLIFLVFVFTSSLVQSIKRIKDVNSSVVGKESELENLQKEQDRLKKELERVQSDEYIEKQLRDNLGLAKEGEITVILPDSEIVKRFAPKLDTEEESLPDPNWKRWLKLFQ
jgi:cell division protein FtsB